MIAREAGRGSSFQGAGLYYLHDKENALTSHRVVFVHCENLPTQDPRKALGWMAWTCHIAPDLKRAAGVAPTGKQGTEKPVYTVTLSWHPEQKPTKADMIEQGRAWLKKQGLEEHQVMMVSHSDRKHPHVHLIVNLVHPATGKVNRLSHSHLKSSRYAQAFEQANGKIYCQQRVENNQARDEGRRVRYREEALPAKAYVRELYHRADSGRAYAAALKEHGLTLAKSKRIVLVDRDGKVYSLYRQLEGVKVPEVKAKLKDLTLPRVEQVQARIEGERKKDQPVEPERPRLTKAAAEAFDRDKQDRKWQESVIDAGIDDATRKAAEKKANFEARQKWRGEQDKREDLRARVSPKLVNDIRMRHERETAEFREAAQKRRDALGEKLAQQYGPQEAQLKADIAALEARRQAKGARQLWRKMTGRDKQEVGALDAKRKTLDSLQWRKTEAVETLEGKIVKQQKGLEAKHRAEWRNLEKTAARYEQGGGRLDDGQLREILERDRAARELQKAQERTKDRGWHR